MVTSRTEDNIKQLTDAHDNWVRMMTSCGNFLVTSGVLFGTKGLASGNVSAVTTSTAEIDSTSMSTLECKALESNGSCVV